MAAQRSKRRSRKRRQTGTVPRAVPAQRSERRTQREVAAREDRRTKSKLDLGERPPNPFGGVPVSEIAILAGMVAAVYGYFQGGGLALFVGVGLVALGVIEFTAREHFAGYRSHATLLAAIPTVVAEFVLVQVLPASVLPVGALVGDAIVFGLMFWLLRGRYTRARQRRIARPPRP
jgi:hypothetical protein